jgi:hypothetical protein
MSQLVLPRRSRAVIVSYLSSTDARLIWPSHRVAGVRGEARDRAGGPGLGAGAGVRPIARAHRRQARDRVDGPVGEAGVRDGGRRRRFGSSHRQSPRRPGRRCGVDRSHPGKGRATRQGDRTTLGCQCLPGESRYVRLGSRCTTRCARRTARSVAWTSWSTTP